ncbi:cupin domain-containing protein [Anianabacter salinae]|uniref:cupin domain-containing protein n=1 Tax=Anianabacter salinae TaxID=2851023 RepID=UPI00225E60EB|nr:cupin domain-containing protein [Anianabacter salinae]MBV0913086.1 cupin domain-containing protein [Anianabacter salinae]
MAQARIIPRDHWRDGADASLWKGRIEGVDVGTDTTVLFYATDKIGTGPRWHVHDYDEIFILTEGRALFTVGDQKIEAQAGDVVIGPAHVPHKYHNLGPGRLTSIDIHCSARWVQTDLDDPEFA